MTETAAPASIGPRHATGPAPHAEHERVLLGHGSGGHLSRLLVRDLILPSLGKTAADLRLDDGRRTRPRTVRRVRPP